MEKGEGERVKEGMDGEGMTEEKDEESGLF